MRSETHLFPAVCANQLVSQSVSTDFVELDYSWATSGWQSAVRMESKRGRTQSVDLLLSDGDLAFYLILLKQSSWRSLPSSLDSNQWLASNYLWSGYSPPALDALKHWLMLPEAKSPSNNIWLFVTQVKKLITEQNNMSSAVSFRLHRPSSDLFEQIKSELKFAPDWFRFGKQAK